MATALSGIQTEITWESTEVVTLHYRSEFEEEWTVVDSATSPYVLQTLPTTTYHYFLHATCHAGDTSFYSLEYSFATPCDFIRDLPWEEGFETVNTNSFPECWSKPLFNRTFPKVVTNYAYLGAKSLGVNTLFAEDPVLMATPVLATSLHEVQLEFWAKREGELSGVLEVGYMTDPEDAETFELIQVIQPDDNNFNYYRVFFHEVPENLLGAIAIKHQANAGSWNYWIDDLLVDSIPNCVLPLDVEAVAITDTSVQIHWSPIHAYDSAWMVLYKMSDSTQWQQQLHTTASPFILSNLIPNTFYDIKVATICGDHHSDTTSIYTFKTNCVPLATLPYTEDFESHEIGVWAFPSCWQKVSTLPNHPYITYYGYEGEGGLFFANEASLQDSNIVATVQLADSIDISSLMVRFYATTTALDMDAPALEIGTIANPNDPSSFTGMDTVRFTNRLEWEEMEFAFEGHQTEDRYIAFKYKASSRYTYAYIDNFTIMNIPSCRRPEVPTVLNLTATTAEVNWDSLYENDTIWNIYYRRDGSNDPWQSQMQVTPPYVIENLDPITTYSFYITTQCLDEESEASHSVQFTTLCPIYTAPTVVETFTEVAPPCWETQSGFLPDTLPASLVVHDNRWRSSSSNLGGAITDAHARVNVYGGMSESADDWMITPSIDLGTSDTLFQIEFDVQLTIWNSTGLPNLTGDDDKFGVIISPDNGITWLKSNATLWTNEEGATRVYNDLATQQHVRIPLMDHEGVPYQGMVKVAFYVESTVNNADNDLHIDNFQITVDTTYTPIVPCNIPAALTVTNLSDSSATIAWTGAASDSLWNLFLAEISDTVEVSDNVFTFESLLSNTTYTAYVRTVCTEGRYSEWTSVEFTTFTPCELPTAVTVTALTDSSATITWTGSAIDTAWQVRLGEMGDTVEVANSTFTFESLLSNTTYTAHVRTVCTEGRYSDWTSVEFTTFTPCELPTELTVTNLSDSSATISWAGAAIDTVWQVRLGEMGDTVEVSDNVFTFESILSNTTYTAYVRTACTEGRYSDWTSVEFTTFTPCELPTAVTVTALTDSSATISWAGAATDTAWQVRLGEMGDTVEVLDNVFTFESLLSNTTYTAYVRTVCTEGRYSDWTSVEFTTMERCDAPTEIAAISETPTTITVSWVATSASVNIRIKEENSEWWDTISVSSSPYIINELLPSTTYSIQMQAVCETITTDWFPSDTLSVTTATPMFTITATAYGPGVVNPDGATQYSAGSTPIYYFESYANVVVERVEVSGNEVETDGMSYQFPPLMQDETIEVYFEALSITETEAMQNMKLYPNPTVASITLHAENVMVEKVEILDMSGRVVLVPNVYQNMNVQSLEPGTYFVRITTTHGVSTLRFVKVAS